MKRLWDNLAVDLIAAALMLAMLMTGYVLRFPLPPGSNKSLALWGLTRHQWGDVHFWVSLGLLTVIGLHVCLHWQWIVISVKRRLSRTTGGSPLVSGLATCLVLGTALALFGWLAQSSVEKVTAPRDGACPPPTDSDVDSPSNAHVQSNVDFWRDVYPVFERSCLSCHGPANPRGDFRIDRRDDLLGKKGEALLIVPGKSAESPLLAIVSGRRDMPMPEAHQLAQREVALLRAWIDSGASWPDHDR